MKVLADFWVLMGTSYLDCRRPPCLLTWRREEKSKLSHGAQMPTPRGAAASSGHVSPGASLDTLHVSGTPASSAQEAPISRLCKCPQSILWELGKWSVALHLSYSLDTTLIL